jgi:hypothetical protein
MVVNTLSAATVQLKLPVEAAKKQPIKMHESARGNVRGRAASIQGFINVLNVGLMFRRVLSAQPSQ